MTRISVASVIAAIFAVQALTAPARADDTTEQKILQRLDALEKQNAALAKENAALSQRLNHVVGAHDPASVTAPPSSTANAPVARGATASAVTQDYDPQPGRPVLGKVPVKYVRACDIYGEGFLYIPGTSACIKIGGYIRMQGGVGTSGDGVVLGADSMALQGRNTRSDSNPGNVMGRAMATIDVRAQTDFGALRGYIRMGAQYVTPNNQQIVPAGTATTTLSNTTAIFWDRGYIQFAGFTAGRQRSFFDIYSPTDGYLTYMNPRTGGDTNLTGVLLVAYTFHFGDGVSATLSVENPNDHFNVGVSNMGLAGQWGLGTLVTDNGLTMNTGGTGFGIPDIVGNLRIDRSWGYAGVSGVLHQVAGGYYTAANTGNPGTGCVAGTQCTNFGHPSDVFGGAIAAGGDLNLPTGPRDTLGVNVVYSDGAVNYAAQGNKWQLYNGNSAGFAWGADGVFDNQTSIATLTGTAIELTRAWSVNSGFEHFWTEQWHTSLYGGFAAINYDSTAKTIINSHLPGAGGASICGTPVFGAVQPPLGIVPGGGNSCNPNYSFWDIGTRTQWNPAPWLDLGVDVSYTRLNTAYAGAGVALGANGANPSGANYTIGNQNVVTVLGRAQLNFDVGK